MEQTSNVTFSSDYLKCPITLDYFEKPVQTTCCGKWISQDSFIQCFDEYMNCPLCKLDLDESDDPRNLPIVKDLQYLCEEAKKNHYVHPTQNISKNAATFSAQIHCLTNNVNGTMVGKLTIKSNKNLNFKTLLIPVLDKSGSMGVTVQKGNTYVSPFDQCKYSMNRLIDLAYNPKNKHLLTNIITYSDRAESLVISTTMSDKHYRNIIDSWSAGGGTSFEAAFDEIVKVLATHKNDTTISSAIVVFLTDGEDSRVTTENRGKLVQTLKTKISEIWPRDYDVHTIGFGKQHDYNFLDNLRKIATKEGAFRYADPTEDTDMLSTKINSILDVVSSSMIIPIKVLGCDLNILSGENTEFWVRLKPIDCVNPRTITVDISGEIHTILIGMEDDQNSLKIWDEWYNILIDKIVQELILIPKFSGTMPLEHQLHLELLDQRSKSIMTKLDSSSDTYKRLEVIVENIKIVQAGGSVDQVKMNDLKFEGKFKSTNIDKLSCNVKSIQKDVEYIPKIQYLYKKSYDFIDKTRVRRFDVVSDNTKISNLKGIVNQVLISINTATEMIKLFGSSTTNEIMEKVSSSKSVADFVDSNGSNIIVFSSAMGRVNLVKKLLEETNINPSEHNNQGYNAIDLAILFGYWLTSDLLLSRGTKITTDLAEKLFLTCIKNKYFKTADVMLKYDLIEPVESMIQYFYDQDQINFISSRLGKVSLHTAITKGIVEKVQYFLPSIVEFSWKPYYEIFQKSTIEHIQIFKMLVDNGIADPFEEFTLPVKYEDGSSFDETVWPLFLAGKRGQNGMFSQILKYYKNPNDLDKQNNNGNTVLWIACDGGHSDIVLQLLSLGADPNIQNLKGDSALIPSCQKGNTTLVEMLLTCGASLDAYNKNRDNPILIACRCGQAKVLDMLFSHVGETKVKEYLLTSAQIDGFVPLHASTELDKLECIKTCVKFGANLEHTTADDNQILKGATALHLACHYGRLNSTMVLVSLGANVKAVTNVDKQTPLHIAISRGHINVVRYLLSLEEGRECLEIEDGAGRLPKYYANMSGNATILEEFFINKLDNLICEALISHSSVEKSCSQVLVEYGTSPLCYDYDGILKNPDILTMAILNGNQHLIQAYMHIDRDSIKSMFLKKDEFGIQPAFWLQYLGYPNILSLPDSATENIQTQLNRFKSLDMQNKMLCSLQPTSHKLLTGSPPNPADKQNNGFDIVIKDSIIANLKKTSTIDYSLLGFMSKLNNSKIFPDGEQMLQYIFMDAKYNVARRIASGETLLQPLHIMALYLYTAHYDIFKHVNMVLKDLNETNFWFPFVNTLYRALELLPPFEGEVYRAVNTKFSLDKYEIGKVLTWNNFSICSSDWKNSADKIQEKSGIVFIIKSKSGKQISRYSKYPVYSEVTFLPATNFVIKNYYIPNIICLGQANIRNTTFRIKEKDIEKAILGESSIIIELEEL